MSKAPSKLLNYPNGCVKTGFNGYLQEYGVYVHGDLYRFDNVVIARISDASYHAGLSVPLHITINKINAWFDQHGVVSTLICMIEGTQGFDYDGVPAGNVSVSILKRQELASGAKEFKEPSRVTKDVAKLWWHKPE